MNKKILMVAGLSLLVTGLAFGTWAAPSTTKKNSEKKLVGSGKTYEYNIVYPSLARVNALKDLEAFLNADVKEVKNLKLTGKKNYKNQIKSTYKTYTSNQITSVVLDIYHYTGGKSGFNYQRAFNYNWQTGARLKYADVLVETKDFTPLAEKLNADLERQLVAKNAGKALDHEAIMWLSDGTEPKNAKNFENFYFDNGKIVWIFEAGQVAEAKYGALKVSLKLQDIKEYIQPKTLTLAGIK